MRRYPCHGCNVETRPFIMSSQRIRSFGSMSPAVEIVEYSDCRLDLQQANRIVKLTNSTWPQTDKTETEIVQELLRRAHLPESPATSKSSRFVILDGDRVVAHANIFVRRIYCGTEGMDVLALAGVCTDPKVRGQGMGVAIVRKAFEKLAELNLDVCLFQTGVASFYEKLGARKIDNQFVNSANATDQVANPWWDKAVMIYPAEADWPNGKIDLGGPGY